MLSVYSLSHPGLQLVSFRLAAGESLVVRGASGSGKTLLLRAIADLDPNQGSIFLEFQARESMPAPQWRRLVCYLPAESGWWAERVRDHFVDWSLALPLVVELNLPEACGEWPIQRLSTGERQRLALIRAMVQKPKILLLDEPTSGLDAESTSRVEALVERHRKAGGGVVWVTHDAAQLKRVASRILVLDGGKATISDNHNVSGNRSNDNRGAEVESPCPTFI